jgi:uncharacterized membrane protein
VAECSVCEFASDAVQQIDAISEAYDQSTVQLQICNHDLLVADVAIAGRQDAISNIWTARGWWQVAPSQCVVVGTYAKGRLSYFARDRRGTWKGDSSFCTASEAFTILLDGEECLDGETTQKFVGIDVGDNSQWTVNLNPAPFTYTAIAYSPSTASWGWSGGGSPEQAKNAAMQWCLAHASDCQIGAWARDDICLALASGPNSNGGTSVGWATGHDYLSAQVNAINNCDRLGGVLLNCRTNLYPLNSRYGHAA